MTKSKTLAVPQFDGRAAKVGEYHTIAMNAANQATAAAIFAGLELRAIQADLRKSATGGTFDDWLDRNQRGLGFARRTAFRYTALADRIKNKLLAARDASLGRLLSLAPSQLSEAQAKLLLQSLRKSVGGVPLGELYLDYGIVKPARKLPVNHNPATNDGSQERKEPTPDLIIQDELFSPIDKLCQQWHMPLKVGKKAVPLWQHIDKPKLRQYVQKMKDMISEAEEALEK
jgi:hypothetical protein